MIGKYQLKLERVYKVNLLWKKVMFNAYPWKDWVFNVKMVFSSFSVEQRTTVGDVCSDPGLTDVLVMGVLIEGF